MRTGSKNLYKTSTAFIRKKKNSERRFLYAIFVSLFFHGLVFVLFTKELLLPGLLSDLSFVSDDNPRVLLEIDGTESTKIPEKAPFAGRKNIKGSGQLTEKEGINVSGNGKNLKKDSDQEHSSPASSSSVSKAVSDSHQKEYEKKDAREASRNNKYDLKTVSQKSKETVAKIQDDKKSGDFREKTLYRAPEYSGQDVENLFRKWSSDASLAAVTENSLFYKFNLGTDGPPRLASQKILFADFLLKLKNYFKKNLTSYIKADEAKNFFMVREDEVTVLGKVYRSGRVTFDRYLSPSRNHQPFMNYLTKGILENGGNLKNLNQDIFPANQNFLYLPVTLRFEETPRRMYWFRIH